MMLSSYTGHIKCVKTTDSVRCANSALVLICHSWQLMHSGIIAWQEEKVQAVWFECREHSSLVNDIQFSVHLCVQ